MSDRIDAAVSLLGAILAEPECYDQAVAAGVELGDFASADHRAIWQAIVALVEEGSTPDLATVADLIQHTQNGDGVRLVKSALDAEEQTLGALYAAPQARLLVERGTAHALARLCEGTARRFADGDRPADVMADFHDSYSEVRGRILAERDDGPHTLKGQLRALLHDIEAAMKGETEPGLKTGIPGVDALLGGLGPGNLVVLGARSGVGKTTLAGNITLHVAERQGGVLFFSAEQPPVEIHKRFLTMLSGVPLPLIRSGRLTGNQLARVVDAASRITRLPLRVVGASGWTPSKLRVAARKYHRTAPVRLVVIDYIQRVHPDPGKKDRSREQEVASIAADLKNLALELGVVVLAPAQLNKQGEVRESDRTFQEADAVLYLHREAGQNDTATSLRVAKHRHGPTGGLDLVFLPDRMRFADLAHDYEETP